MDSALGVQLDGFAVKEKAGVSENLLNAELTFLGSGYYPCPVGVLGCEKAHFCGALYHWQAGTPAVGADADPPKRTHLKNF